MIADYINGAFELAGGLFVLNHCRAVVRDKAVAGVSILSTIFFHRLGHLESLLLPELEPMGVLRRRSFHRRRELHLDWTHG